MVRLMQFSTETPYDNLTVDFFRLDIGRVPVARTGLPAVANLNQIGNAVCSSSWSFLKQSVLIDGRWHDLNKAITLGYFDSRIHP